LQLYSFLSGNFVNPNRKAILRTQQESVAWETV
jgi:hypothetical protein